MTPHEQAGVAWPHSTIAHLIELANARPRIRTHADSLRRRLSDTSRAYPRREAGQPRPRLEPLVTALVIALRVVAPLLAAPTDEGVAREHDCFLDAARRTETYEAPKGSERMES